MDPMLVIGGLGALFVLSMVVALVCAVIATLALASAVREARENLGRRGDYQLTRDAWDGRINKEWSREGAGHA